jgi:AraC-like DNA-binding protein
MCIKFTLLKDREAVIKSLTHWIDSNLYRPITVLDVARKSGYSLAYIQRNFRQECGISIGLYIRSRKLEKAAHMLRHTQLSVSDIFTMLGTRSRQRSAERSRINMDSPQPNTASWLKKVTT